MKEAFDLIRKRIEEITVDRNIYGSITGCNMGICEDDDCLKCLKKKIRSIVSEVEAEYGNGWIPCNRADHPYDGQIVLACINTRIATHKIIITDYNGEIYWFDGTISAWMPLPEAYKPTND